VIESVAIKTTLVRRSSGLCTVASINYRPINEIRPLTILFIHSSQDSRSIIALPDGSTTARIIMLEMNRYAKERR